ncbi:hypothetical protein LTR78_000397 [Recurvomyces mirabilis]|uniref:Uncharacterized protein n=1 Tax=Recurvomyces mirabilis TaxID=574656 RepID=A0AAE0WYC6_9PEZI|nr:hypothetical protein LTR78_000397 [Recurvomyces mirabilis]KAK5162052.1 hypothetical protein LTS14_000398 [Recurvomyces mirabilis]
MSFWQHVRKPKPLEAGERPHQLLWYLARGRMTASLPNNGVPTAATPRERRKVEETNRKAVGFWGTVRDSSLPEAVRRINDTDKEAVSGSAEEAHETAEAMEMEASNANKGVEESARTSGGPEEERTAAEVREPEDGKETSGTAPAQLGELKKRD